METRHSNTVISPNDGETIGSWTETGDGTIDTILSRLATAERQLFQDIDLRRGILQDIHDALLVHRDALARIVVDECGKTPLEANGEVDYAVSFLAYCRDRLGSFSFHEQRDGGREIRDVPIGAALLITPYNDPLAGITRKIAPAIAAGCPVVVKPSPLGILCAKEIEKVLPRSASPFVQFAYLREPERVRKIILAREISIVSFTGSTEAGRAIAGTAAIRPIPTILELGGNCPFVILPGADVEVTVEDIIQRRIRAAGQACSAVNRVLVHEDLYLPLLERLSLRVASIACGPSDDERSAFGPVRTDDLMKRLSQILEKSLTEGSAIVSRGSVIPNRKAGFFFPLTVVENKSTLGVLDREESFGPLFSVRKYTTVEDVIANLTHNRQRLVAYVYGRETASFVDRLRPLKFGSIGVNTTRIQSADVPTGGFGDAGFGREGGDWGIRAFLASINLRHQ